MLLLRLSLLEVALAEAVLALHLEAAVLVGFCK
jgi:hypothetical protein